MSECMEHMALQKYNSPYSFLRYHVSGAEMNLIKSAIMADSMREDIRGTALGLCYLSRKDVLSFLQANALRV